MDNVEICELMKQRRKDLGLTLDEVAQSVGVNQSTVSRWESGQIEEMKRGKIEKLADTLEINPALLMGWDNYLKLSPEQNELIANYNKMTDKIRARLLAYSQLLLDNVEVNLTQETKNNLAAAQKMYDESARKIKESMEKTTKKED